MGDGWGFPSPSPEGVLVFKLVFLFFALFVFAVLFEVGLSDARSFGKGFLESGAVDWQRYRRTRLWALGISVLGAVAATVGLSTFVTNVGPLELFGLKLQSSLPTFGVDVIIFLVTLFGGLSLLGLGLGFGVGSLIFPVKKPQQVDKPLVS